MDTLNFSVATLCFPLIDGILFTQLVQYYEKPRKNEQLSIAWNEIVSRSLLLSNTIPRPVHRRAPIS